MAVEIVSNHKLICFSKKYYLYSRGTKLIITEDEHGSGGTSVYLPTSKVKEKLGSVRLMARALRLESRCGIFVDEDTALVSFHGAIYRVDCAGGHIDLEHEYRPEMNNPLQFVRLTGVAGFTDGIYYGEYYLNHDRAEVRIMRREADGSWQAVYTFAAGSIYHIHGIVPGYYKDRVYVLTGDDDAESGIWECRDDFASVKPILQGKQAYRACVALPTAEGIIYATDTPLEQNYIYHYSFATGDIDVVAPIDGPSIYGRVLSDSEMVISTSVEPDSRLVRWRYEFSYGLGPGVKNRYSHIYYIKALDDTFDVKEIHRAKKDILPMGAGQFGTMMFPAGDEELFVTGQALRKYDNKTFSIDRE